MREAASILLDDLDAESRASVVLFDPDWHQGVIGILAGRVKEKLHRPTFAFARGKDGEIKGSGRSIPGLHLRDALDLVAKRRPQLLKRFGGHAAAAGLTLLEADLAEFETEFEAVARELIAPEELQRTLVTDGALEEGYRGLETARMLQAEIWGQGFPAPVFADVFDVDRQKLLKDKHLKLALRQGRTHFEAIRFNSAEPAPARIEAAYRLDINEWNGLASVQLLIEDFRAAV
jgi:single-stranded-DNA-specific exonuclease